MLEHNVLSIDEIIDLFSKVDSKLVSVNDIINFIKLKKEPKDDEAVYLSEKVEIHLTFDEIKNHVIKSLKISVA
jgi:hypothetical protein